MSHFHSEIKFVGANCCSRGRFCVCVQHIILCCDTWPMELICISLWKRDLTHPSLVCRRMSRHIIGGSIYVGNVPFGFECSENCVWCCCHLCMYTLRVTLLFSLCIWFCVAERPSARRPARHKRRARAYEIYKWDIESMKFEFSHFVTLSLRCDFTPLFYPRAEMRFE